MRQKRVKQYRKVMQLYQTTYGFREPYQLLADSEFVKAFVDQKLDFEARIRDVLQGNVKPMITQCCISALYDLGQPGQKYVELAKTFERRKCGHFKARLQSECLKQMLGTENKNRYVFATQDRELREALRTVAGTPIVYVSRSVVLLESVSVATTRHRRKLESSKLHASKEELALLSGRKLSPPPTPAEDGPSHTDEDDQAAGEENAAPEQKKKKKRKGPSGPNPLSVKKPTTKKRQRDDQDANDSAVKKAKVESMPRMSNDATTTMTKRKRKRKSKSGKTETGTDT